MRPPPSPPALPFSRFVKRGPYMICTICDLSAQYCMCGLRARPAPEDESALVDLERRANECKGGK